MKIIICSVSVLKENIFLRIIDIDNIYKITINKVLYTF